MSIKAKKSQVNYPRAVQNNKPQGVFHPNYDGGFFQTEPRIAYGGRSSSTLPHANAHAYDYAQSSPKEKVVAYPMNASFVDRPSHSIYTAVVPNGYVSGYMSPPARLDDGLFKKLYTGTIKDSPYPAGRKTDVERDLEKYGSSNKFAKRDYSVPVYSNRLPEPSIFDDPKFVSYLNSQDNQKSNSVHASPSILKKSTPRRTPEQRFYQERPAQIHEPSGISQALYQSHSVKNANVPRDFSQNMFRNNQVVTSSIPSIAEHFHTEGSQEQQRKPLEDKYPVAKEIISPTYQKSTFGRGTRRWPLMEDTAKMRNPLFHTHDFADFDKSNLLNKPRYKDGGYNYADANPLNAKQYISKHKVTIAQVDADNHPVNHSFKIDPSYGVLPITEGEKRSIGDLKQRNAQHFHSTQILRKNLALEAVNNSFNGSINSLTRSRINLDLPHIVSDRQPNEANKHTTDYTRSYGGSPVLHPVEREQLKTFARFKVLPLGPQVGKQISPPW